MGLKLADVLVGLSILIVGLLLSQRYETKGIVVVAIITTFVMFVTIARRLRSMTKEVFITGILVTAPETYVFLIQPNVAGLAPLPGNVELFFGAAIFTRLLLLLGQLVENPFQKPLKKVTGLG